MSGYRPPYTLQEEEEILKFIIRNKCYLRLRGRAVWQEMEKEGVGNERTYQSLKEHFRMYMAKRLNSSHYVLIDANELMKIKRGYLATAVGANPDRKKNVVRKIQDDLNKTSPTWKIAIPSDVSWFFIFWTKNVDCFKWIVYLFSFYLYIHIPFFYNKYFVFWSK